MWGRASCSKLSWAGPPHEGGGGLPACGGLLFPYIPYVSYIPHIGIGVKYLLVLLVVGVGFWMLLSRLRGPGAGRRDGASTTTTPPPTPGPVVMVACAHCGLHLASADAVADGAQAYCTDAHRRLGPQARP